jgi:hypothetical protein
MGFKDLLGTLSPVYGAVTGEGAMGQMLNPAEAGKIAAKEQEEKERQSIMATQARMKLAGAGMKKGGKVSSASSRADGIAQRGKTRGTMVMCGGGTAKGKK